MKRDKQEFFRSQERNKKIIFFHREMNYQRFVFLKVNSENIAKGMRKSTRNDLKHENMMYCKEEVSMEKQYTYSMTKYPISPYHNNPT